MRLRLVSYVFTSLVIILLLGLVGRVWLGHRRQAVWLPQPKVVQARHPTKQASLPLNPQVRVGTPVEGPTITPRYTYRNEFPSNRAKWQTLFLIDRQTGQETRLGDDSYAAVFGVMNDEDLVWYFKGTHAYRLATGEDTLLSQAMSPAIHPQIAGDWVAFGQFNYDEMKTATLYAGNLQTHEIITLTQDLNARDVYGNEYFGIGTRLAAWYDFVPGKPVGLVIYDLASHTQLAKLTNWESAFGEQNVEVHDVAAGETVITWNDVYGYDLVTHSYFWILDFHPPNWTIPPIFEWGRLTEKERVLSQTLYLKDGTQRTISAPLLDATPSAAPCLEGQNLVQNGDLEDIAAHNLWQQSGSSSDLIVSDPPPGLATGGHWAIRLGRVNNSTASIQQTVAIPSNVKTLTLTLAVRVHSWDLWGGDHFQIDVLNPLTGASLLATPVQWTNVQLATGDWVPLQVTIQAWPGIDTPVQLVFRTLTDWAFPTDFTLDNLRFVTACQ